MTGNKDQGGKRRVFCCKLFESHLPRIHVTDPLTHSTWEEGRYTSYKICIKTDHPAFQISQSGVRRRFSELRWLYSVLKANHKYIKFPPVPSKKLFSIRFNSEFIQTRAEDMERFLNELVKTDLVLGDSAFHLFLQTDLTTQEMDSYFSGKLPESFITSAWAKGGHVHTPSVSPGSCSPRVISMDQEDEALRVQEEERKEMEAMALRNGHALKHEVTLTGQLEGAQGRNQVERSRCAVFSKSER